MHYRLARLGVLVLLAGCGQKSRFDKEPEWCPENWQAALEEGLAASLCELGTRCGEEGGEDWIPPHFTDPEYQWYFCGPDPVASFLATAAEADEEMGNDTPCIVPCGLRDCYHALQEILEQEECPPAPSSFEEGLFENECVYWHKRTARPIPPDYVEEECEDPWVMETW